MDFLIPVEPPIKDNENNIELALAADLNTLLYKVLSSPVFSISQLVRILDALETSLTRNNTLLRGYGLLMCLFLHINYSIILITAS